MQPEDPSNPQHRPPPQFLTRPTSHADTFLKSSFFEQLVEHVFISELLQEVYYRFGMTVEVLRSEIDASGYDVVFECNGVTSGTPTRSKSSSERSRCQ